ncbi:MAG: UDP-2,3-diacylglucosamine diphosphatase [Oleibacter sp.]|nr:UDP-2,3-diacylglucosamine diphosphatase [Thalassolituus sp.]
MTSYFISDLHLEPEHPAMTEGFLELLQRLHGEEALYILGDFFEVWMGDDFENDFVRTVKDGLKALSDSGTQVFLMPGNRDFLLGDLFCQQTGTQMLEDPTTVTLNGEAVLLMHGDSLCTADVEYQKFRANMRNPQWQQMILQRPLKDRQQMARQLREISMAKNQGKEEFIMDVTPEEVVKDLETHGVQRMIHGHTHRPAVHELTANGSPAKRIVLGDWDKNVWWLEAEPGKEPELFKEPL